ncbi:MAG: FtsX-like permease family protein [Chloroflexota bacterium]
MFLAINELKHSRFRYLMVGAIITLIAWLAFLLAGLANGLVADTGAALLDMKADHLIFQSNVRLFIHRSVLPEAMVNEVRELPGVTAATPLGHLTIVVTRASDSDQIDVTVLAIDPTGFLAPAIIEGESLVSAPEGGIVVDESMKRRGVQLGDTLRITGAEMELTVIGFTAGQTYNHIPVIFMDLLRWRSLKFAAPGSDRGVVDPVSIIAVQMDEAAATQVAATLSGVEIVTPKVALDHLPGYKEEQSSILMIEVFLFVIAAFIVAVFFYVITLQKTNQFGVLKAFGASTGFLARGLIGQVLCLSLIGIGLGALLTYSVAAIMPESIPFNLAREIVVNYSAVLLLVALGGALLSLRQIATIDPLIAIGRID